MEAVLLSVPVCSPLAAPQLSAVLLLAALCDLCSQGGCVHDIAHLFDVAPGDAARRPALPVRFSSTAVGTAVCSSAARALVTFCRTISHVKAA
jgi:hypothetical protein